MPENPVLNEGVGGSTARGLADSTGKVWFPAVACYATTVSPNANVLQVVTSSTPMPVTFPVGSVFTLGPESVVQVEQADETLNHTTSHQGGAWEVSLATGTEVDLATGATVALAAGTTVIATQSAPWSVTQSGTWNVGITGTAAVTQSGTWNVATVSTVTTVAAVTAITNALPAGTNLLGKAVAVPESEFIYVNGVAVPVKLIPFSASSSGATQVLAAVTGKKIRVVKLFFSASADVNVKWQSATTDITGLDYLAAKCRSGGAYCPVGLFETASGQALNINLSAAVAVGGHLSYIEA